PALAHARGVGPARRQPAGGRLRARAHRSHHHRGGVDHGRRVRGLLGRQLRRAAGVRRRPVGGDPAGRDDRPDAARAGDDEAARALELVPARARTARPAAGSCLIQPAMGGALRFTVTAPAALAAAALALAAAPARAADDYPVCTGDTSAADVAQKPGPALRMGITPRVQAGQVGPMPAPAVPEDPAKTLAALGRLRPPDGPFVVRL